MLYIFAHFNSKYFLTDSLNRNQFTIFLADQSNIKEDT